MMTYKLSYLPLFEQDVLAVLDYISTALQNPSAAHEFIDNLEQAILNRLKSPLAFEPYPSAKMREHQYYRIYLGNYTAYYVVLDNTMEMRRLLYSPRNHEKLIDQQN